MEGDAQGSCTGWAEAPWPNTATGGGAFCGGVLQLPCVREREKARLAVPSSFACRRGRGRGALST
eukprot:4638219-Alexandrium_andersonii.AAC.1